MALVIAVDDPRRDDARAVLAKHLRFAHQVTPPEGVHALDLDGLLDPTVLFFSARSDDAVVAVGALKHLDDRHAELKSMHVVESARRHGIGRVLVERLLAVAAERGYRRVSLETGTMEAFAPARSFYAAIGFQSCEPFGQYASSSTSACMTILI